MQGYNKNKRAIRTRYTNWFEEKKKRVLVYTLVPSLVFKDIRSLKKQVSRN